MCEFKIIKQNDGSQILEDIVVLSYTDDNELLFRDILGMGEIIESALIYNVNTLNQTCVIVEHPLIKDFFNLIKNVNNDTISNNDIENFQKRLEELKVRR
ncbi:MAG: CooT family nickel-binding protein [Candidatus Hodarchaeota archaeon]